MSDLFIIDEAQRYWKKRRQFMNLQGLFWCFWDAWRYRSPYGFFWALRFELRQWNGRRKFNKIF
jgi:hypothetical protein